MDTYINRKQVLQQYGFDVRKEQWEAGDVQERPKGVGKEKWYRVEAVAAKAMAKLESVPVERVVEQQVVPEQVVLEQVVPEPEQAEVPALRSAEHSALRSVEPCSRLHKSESVESVVVAKRAMNFRFVIGTKGEVVRVQDNKRVKIGMRMAVRATSPGHYVSREVVR